ncbi:MAG: SoxR reducing system RseC family protein [Paludibacteraceae bacterium]|nr:SoxR reducing system RseC family protein [Paludibacteraceae bacterium]
MKETIEHRGVVVALLSGGVVRVRIEQESACGGCSAKGRCMAAERKEKVIDCVWKAGDEVGMRGGSGFVDEVGSGFGSGGGSGEGSKEGLRGGSGDGVNVGDEVVVEVESRLGWKAVLLAFLLPLLVMIVVLLLVSRWYDDVVSGTAALCSLGVYYILLRLLGGRKIEREFVFVARKV